MDYSPYFDGQIPADREYLNGLPKDLLIDMRDALDHAVMANKCAGLSASGRFDGSQFCSVMAFLLAIMDYGLFPAQAGEILSRWLERRKRINGCYCQVSGLNIEV